MEIRDNWGSFSARIHVWGRATAHARKDSTCENGPDAMLQHHLISCSQSERKHKSFANLNFSDKLQVMLITQTYNMSMALEVRVPTYQSLVKAPSTENILQTLSLLSTDAQRLSIR